MRNPKSVAPHPDTGKHSRRIEAFKRVPRAGFDLADFTLAHMFHVKQWIRCPIEADLRS